MSLFSKVRAAAATAVRCATGAQSARVLHGSGRIASAMSVLACAVLAASCVDKSFVGTDVRPGDARLGVSVSLGALAADGDISAIHLVARYLQPTDGLVTLADVTVPYVQGDTRDVALSLDLTQCLREVGGSDPATAACPVTVTVEVLAQTRVLARDVLPTIRLRPGQSITAPALAARSATSLGVRTGGAAAPAAIALPVAGTVALEGEPRDALGVAIAGRTIGWTSSAPGIATVSSTGIVTAVSSGSATITASTGAGSAVLTIGTVINVFVPVPAAVSIAPTTAQVAVGGTQTLAATVRDASGIAITPTPVVSWTSGSPSVATVSQTGVVTGVAAGSAVITVRTGNGLTATATVTVAPVAATVVLTPATATLLVGTTRTLVPSVRDATGADITPTPALTYQTSDATVATVTQAGVVTAIAIGTANISARTAAGLVGNAIITVVSQATSLELTPTTSSVFVGGTTTLTPVARDAGGAAISPAPAVTWTSSAASVATVSAAGVVTGVAVGTAVITARTSAGLTATATVTVSAVPASVVLTPATTQLTVGSTRTLVPTVNSAGGTAITPTPALTWTSSAPAVATVSQTGVVTAVANGVTTISARTANGIVGTAEVSVVSQPATINLTPTSIGFPIGSTQAITSVVRDAFGTVITPTPTLTYTSSNSGVATVSSAGVITAVANGFSTITVRTSNNITGTVSVTVGEVGTLSGRILDYGTNTGIANASVAISNGGSLVRTVTTDASGNYTSGMLIGSSFDLRASASGYVTADIRGIVNGGTRTVDATPLARVQSFPGNIAGSLYNATTNQLIATTGTVDLYSGANTTSGTPVASVQTVMGQGYVFGSIPAGTYTAVARVNGFTNASRTVVSLGNSQTAGNQNLFLSPSASSSTLRIVLTWGDAPADLDAHLTGPAPSSATFWVYWQQRGSCTSTPFACLDVDVLNGRGPETITIAQSTPGKYVYSVHDYTNFGLTGSTALARSGARVDVYSGTMLLRTFAVPNLAGTLWTVFEWDGTTITPRNTVSDASPPGNLLSGSVMGGNANASLVGSGSPFGRMPRKPRR